MPLFQGRGKLISELLHRDSGLVVLLDLFSYLTHGAYLLPNLIHEIYGITPSR